MLPYLEHRTAQKVDSWVIWLHGLGADGYDFYPIVPQLALPKTAGIEFLFPHAPVMPVSINNGYQMPAWYDIKGAELSQRIDQTGILKSVEQMKQLIAAKQKEGLTLDRLVLAGFSQGGVIALQTALSLDQPVAGVMALSTYFPFGEQLAAARQPHQLSILMVHGTEDAVVSLQLGQNSRDELLKLKQQVQWQTYPMGHSVHPEQMALMGRYLTERLSKK